MRKLRLLLRPTVKNKDEQKVIRIGACFGYWPCLKAPYLQLSLGIYIVDLWYGAPSYNKGVPNDAIQGPRSTHQNKERA